jgi:hypothetical protein
MKCNRIVLFLFLSFIAQVFSQEEAIIKSSPKHSLGLHAGATTGLGFSYRYLDKKLGLQLTGIPIFLGDGENFYSLGGTILFRAKESRRVDVLAYLGNHYTHNSVNDRSRYHLGLGGGINLHAWIDVLDISFQAGYGVYNINNDPFSFLTGEIGVYFRF